MVLMKNNNTNINMRVRASHRSRNGGSFAIMILVTSFLFPYQEAVGGELAAVDLGSAAHFTILSGAAVSTTGGGMINGDVGAYPISGSAIGITTAQVNGIIYAVDGSGPAGSVVASNLLAAAKSDLSIAYNEAAGRMPVPMGDFLNPGDGNMGGLSLVAGLYKFTGAALITGGALTLTGNVNDVWIFQIGSTLTVGEGMQVTLTEGAQGRNVFWQVGTSAIILSSASFAGTIMADQAITMYAGSTLSGRALARAAAVTFNGQAGSLPLPEAPRFTYIGRTTNDTMTINVDTTPYVLLTLEYCADLLHTNWTTLDTETPSVSLWTYADSMETGSVSQRFYRAFLSP